MPSTSTTPHRVITGLPFYAYWAKTGKEAEDGKVPSYHLLPYHNLDVAAVAYVLLRNDPVLRERLARVLAMKEERLVQLMCFLIALHDVGKFGEGFQNLNTRLFQHLRGRTSNKAYVLRHDSLGYLAWHGFLFDAGYEQGWLGPNTRRRAPSKRRRWMSRLMRAIAGHHGVPPYEKQRRECNEHFDDEAREAAIAYAASCGQYFLSDIEWPDDAATLDRSGHASWLVAGLTVLSDWIGSNQTFFEFLPDPIGLELYWKKHALPQAYDAIPQTGVLGSQASSVSGFRGLFPEYDPTPMQHMASAIGVAAGPQLFILEDMTGNGKSEAALTLAHRILRAGDAAGLFIGLPTMATADAMYARMASYFESFFEVPEQASLVLAHSQRHLSDAFQTSIRVAPDAARSRAYDAVGRDETAEAQAVRWLADSRKKALLANLGVGTIDQALLGVLPSNHQSLRLLGTGRNVLIVDEVHAYDAYTQELLESLLTFQAAMGGSAILLSATLPKGQRQALCDAFRRGLDAPSKPIRKTEAEHFPLITRVDGGSTGVHEEAVAREPKKRRKVAVRPLHSEEDTVRLLLEKAQAGQCACWIRNTVDDARRAYQKLCQVARTTKGVHEDRIALFHARFAHVDRRLIEDSVLEHFGKESTAENRRGRILVSTQVVEQSLDADWDVMASDLAPIDLIIQRAGRQHRHVRDAEGNLLTEQDARDGRPAPELGVLMPPFTTDPAPDWYSKLFPRAAFVYANAGELWLTAQTLVTEGEIVVPDEARELVESVYSAESQRGIPAALQEATRIAVEERVRHGIQARYNALSLAEGYKRAGSWNDEDDAPTRLGDETSILRLARLSKGRLVPWANDGKPNPWERSEVRVRHAVVAKEAKHPKDVQKLVDSARLEMPDEGRWRILVPLSARSGSIWTGAARNARGEPVQVTYSTTTGLIVSSP